MIFQTSKGNFPVIVKRSKRRRRTIALKVNQVENGWQIIVYTPYRYSDKKVKKFLERNQNGLFSLISRSNKAKQSRLQGFKNGHKIPILGREYFLQVVEVNESSGLENSFELGRKYLYLYIKDGFKQSSLDQLIQRFYHQKTEQYLPEKIEYWAKKINVKYNKVRVKDVRSLWGSCSPKGNLTFRWQTVSRVPGVVDYLIIHELCHLKHPNHSQKFWQEVAKYDPEYKKHRKELRN